MNTITTKVPMQAVTENKKRKLDSLTLQVLDATDEVSQLQAIVNSLTSKFNTYTDFLTQANANLTQAKNNVSLMNSVVNNARNLSTNSKIAFDEVVHANNKTKEVAKHTTNVINKLIYTAEMINKLAGLVTRKKAQNPLISDQLITMVTNAGTNANNAVALTLVALNTTYTAHSTNKNTENTAALENIQAQKLLSKLTDDKTEGSNISLNTLLKTAYTTASDRLSKTQKAYEETLNQLNLKTADLNKAQINLKSLQSGLAAANAAALAS